MANLLLQDDRIQLDVESGVRVTRYFGAGLVQSQVNLAYQLDASGENTDVRIRSYALDLSAETATPAGTLQEYRVGTGTLPNTSQFAGYDVVRFGQHNVHIFAINNFADMTFSKVSFHTAGQPIPNPYKTFNIIKPTGDASVEILAVAFDAVNNKLGIFGKIISSENTNVTNRTFIKLIDTGDLSNTNITHNDTTILLTGNELNHIGPHNLSVINSATFFEGKFYLLAYNLSVSERSPSNTSSSTLRISCFTPNNTSNLLIFINEQVIFKLTTPDPLSGFIHIFSDDANDNFFLTAHNSDDLSTAFTLLRYEIPPNELPIFDVNTRLLTETTIRANAPIGFVVRNVTATDPDDEQNRITFSLTGTDAALFAISLTGVITVNAALVNDTTYNITAVATDNDSGVTEQALTVVVLLANLPVLPNLRQNWQIDKDTGADIAVGSVNATQVDDLAITYSLTGADAAHFAIDDTGAVTTVLASYTDRDYLFEIVATDSASSTNTVNVRVSLYKMAVAQTTYDWTTSRVPDRIYERNRIAFITSFTTSSGGTTERRFLRDSEAVVNLAVIGVAGIPENTITVELSGNDAEFFFVQEQTVFISRQLDVDRIYVFDVTATFPDGIRASERAFISVYDDDTVYELASTGNEVINMELGTPIGTIIGTLDASPPDKPFVYLHAIQELEATGIIPRFGKIFDIDPVTGNVRNRIQPTEVAMYNATGSGQGIKWRCLTPDDQDTPSSVFLELRILQFNILSSESDAPFYDPPTRNVELPPTLSGFVADLSVANGTVYSIYGRDAVRFVINALTGFLRIRSSLSADDLPFEIIAVASNSQGESSQLQVTFDTIADEVPDIVQSNRAPIFPTASQTFLLMNPPTGTNEIGTVTATDPDGDLVTYSVESITPRPPNRLTFAVSSAGLVSYTLASGTYPIVDYVVTVKAEDPLQLSDTIDVHVRTRDPNVNNSPFFDESEHTFLIEPNPEINQILGTIVATDPDGDALTYTLTAGNSALFSVNSNGVIRVSGTLQNARTYTFNLNAADADEDATIFITVIVSAIDIDVTIPETVLPEGETFEGYQGFVEISGLAANETIKFLAADNARLYAFVENLTDTAQGVRFIGRDGVVFTDSNFDIPLSRVILGMARVLTTLGFLTMEGTTGALQHYDLDGTRTRLQELTEINYIDDIDLESLPTYGLEFDTFENNYKIYAAGYHRVVRDVDYGDETGRVIIWELTLSSFLGRPLGNWIATDRPIPLHSSTYGDRKHYLEFIAGRVDIYTSSFVFEGTLDTSVATELGNIVDMAFSRGQVLILDDTGKIHYFGREVALAEIPDGVRQLEIIDDVQNFDIVRITEDFNVIANNVPANQQTALELVEVESRNIAESLSRVNITPVTTIPTVQIGDRVFLHTGDADVLPSALPSTGVYEILGIITSGTTTQSFICESVTS